MQIERILVLSTAHIPPATGADLDAKAPWTNDLIIYPHREYGWLISILSQIDDESEIGKCLSFAALNGCDWLLLDRDGPEIDELPTFDWN